MNNILSNGEKKIKIWAAAMAPAKVLKAYILVSEVSQLKYSDFI